MAMDPTVRAARLQLEDAFSRNDFAAAFHISLPWATEGHGWAEGCVGSLYQCGLGVPCDLKKAVEYLERAGAHGFPGAWHNLGVIYEVGSDDVPRDLELAYGYYRRAHAAGYYPGMADLEGLDEADL